MAIMKRKACAWIGIGIVIALTLVVSACGGGGGSGSNGQGPADTLPPTIQAASASACEDSGTTGSNVTNTLCLTVSAQDNVGIAKIDMYSDADVLLGQLANGGQKYITGLSSNQTFTFYAKVYDSSGNVAVSDLFSGKTNLNCLSLPTGTALSLDGDIADLSALNALLAVSSADGAGTGATADFERDGTVTELYGIPYDSNGDGMADYLWIGVRGEYFTTTASINGTFVAIDADPGKGTGATSLSTNASTLTDANGVLDNDITESGVVLSTALTNQNIGIDAVAGITSKPTATSGLCTDADLCGLRGFGSGGLAGATSNFAWLTAGVALGAVQSGLPAAAGAGYAAPQGIEFRIPLGQLGSPSMVAIAVYSSGDGTLPPSPNTLPENSSNAYTAPQTIESVVYVRMNRCQN